MMYSWWGHSVKPNARIGLSQNAIEDLERSGLTPQDVAARVLTGAELAATGIESSALEGYVLPYFDIHGDILPYYRIKILTLHHNVKYRGIKDAPNYVYFPPKLPALMSSGYAPNFMIITEGEKKAAAAVKAGFPCVALAGVDSWKTRNILLPEETQLKALKGRKAIQARIPRGDANNHVFQESGVLATGFHDLVDFLVKRDMEAIIIYDSEGPEGVKAQVQRAAAELGYELRYRGLPIAQIRQAILPAGKEKVGIDDYIQSKGVKAFAQVIRTCRQKRIAFPRHPNPKTFIASRLQKARLSRKETQDVALSILMELETRGRRLRNRATQEMFYFSDLTHTLMPVQLGNPRVTLHDTAFGAYLYREFNLASIDQRVVGWLAAQFHGEPGVEEAITHKVLCRPPELRDCVAYQLSDSHFVVVTPNATQPYTVCLNGTHGVLFEQGHVESIDHTHFEMDMDAALDDKEVYWEDVMSGFDFMPSIPAEAQDEITEGRDELLRQGRLLATLLYYLSPWLLRWRGTQLPVEMVIGEPGSGKSSLFALRQTIITGQPRLSNMTNDIRDWYAGITSGGGLYVLDNVHFTGSNKDYQQRLSDELCRLVTEPDPHVELRKLYTTSDAVSLPVNTTFAITSLEQPFFTTDLIQRAAIFELQAISSGHDARWVEKQIARTGSRSAWVAHHLAVIHKFLVRAQKEWDNDFKAGHRLANYEQALTLMAKVLELPHDWIPSALHRQTVIKMSDTDWTLAGLAEFVMEFKEQHGVGSKERFCVRDITEWADSHDTYAKNSILTNSWKLGKYIRSHKGSIQKNLHIIESGTLNNKAMYTVAGGLSHE